MDSGMRWLLSSATSPSMASSNADRVVMAAVPGFGFPVDAPNVATPRGLRNEKDTNGTSVSQANDATLRDDPGRNFARAGEAETERKKRSGDVCHAAKRFPLSRGNKLRPSSPISLPSSRSCQIQVGGNAFGGLQNGNKQIKHIYIMASSTASFTKEILVATEPDSSLVHKYFNSY
ncbi:hypothetical protein DAPPUDRAFT_262756 [Daphnia pulex]|uniref:Uncharacterized protein n=1 Tax=Daphnia pulex TaxID=6669 RepID=E9HNM3_DAPPU|nr:hypothetical protein DAPPUDRAFT_262756 [Daphnia pulex]|eukprot:EFX66631.1 hypothetical protein DAPPUDRAFT_262756 [Daphnia pulex]